MRRVITKREFLLWPNKYLKGIKEGEVLVVTKRGEEEYCIMRASKLKEVKDG